MKYKITSAYELLEGMFGHNIRLAGSALFLLVRISCMCFIVYTCAIAISTITQVSLIYIVAFVGLLTTLYTVKGGMDAVIITDNIQYAILLCGPIFLVGYITYRCGGFGWWPSFSSPEVAALDWPKVKIFSFNPFDRVTVTGAVFTTSLWWICMAASDQVAIQRYLCTRDVRAARSSFMHCLIADFAGSVILWGTGIALLGYFLKFRNELPIAGSITSQADKLFPHFIGTILPHGMVGIMVAALLGAAMESLSSGINSVGTVIVTDFKRWSAKGCNDENALVKRAKKIGMIVGILTTVLSYSVLLIPGKNLMDINYRIGLYFGVPLVTLFIMAFFVPFGTPAGAWAAIIIGFFAGVLFSFWQQIVGLFTKTGDFSIILIMPATLVFSLAAGILVSMFTKPRAQACTLILREETVESVR
jgi:Na+/proline symporter